MEEGIKLWEFDFTFTICLGTSTPPINESSDLVEYMVVVRGISALVVALIISARLANLPRVLHLDYLITVGHLNNNPYQVSTQIQHQIFEAMATCSIIDQLKGKKHGFNALRSKEARTSEAQCSYDQETSTLEFLV